MTATLQSVNEAISALRDKDDPDRTRTAALKLSRAIHRLQEELPTDSLSDEERAQLAITQSTLEDLLTRLASRASSDSAHRIAGNTSSQAHGD